MWIVLEVRPDAIPCGRSTAPFSRSEACTNYDEEQPTKPGAALVLKQKDLLRPQKINSTERKLKLVIDQTRKANT